MTLRQFLNDLWAEKGVILTVAPLEELKRTEWSPLFEKLMRNRLVMGAFRYGRLRDRRKPKWDRVTYAIKKLEDYKKTRNSETLVDVANMMLLEFEEGDNHFEALCDGFHVEQKEK